MRGLPDLTVLRARTGYTPAVPLAADLQLTYEWVLAVIACYSPGLG